MDREHRHPAAPGAAPVPRRRRRRRPQPSEMGHGVGVAAAGPARPRPDVARWWTTTSCSTTTTASRSATRTRPGVRSTSLGSARPCCSAHHGVLVVADDVGQAYARCMSLEWRCRMAWHVEALGGRAAMPAEASQRLARGIDRRGYPGLWEAMARQEIQLDPRVLELTGRRPARANLAELRPARQRTATVTFIPEPEPEELFCPAHLRRRSRPRAPDRFRGPPAGSVRRRGSSRSSGRRAAMPWWIVDGRRLPILVRQRRRGPRPAGVEGCLPLPLQRLPPLGRPIPSPASPTWTVTGRVGVAVLRVHGLGLCRQPVLQDSPTPRLGLASPAGLQRWMVEDWCATDPEPVRPLPASVAARRRTWRPTRSGATPSAASAP